MTLREVIAVDSVNRVKPTNMLCAVGTYNNQFA